MTLYSLNRLDRGGTAPRSSTARPSNISRTNRQPQEHVFPACGARDGWVPVDRKRPQPFMKLPPDDQSCARSLCTVHCTEEAVSARRLLFVPLLAAQYSRCATPSADQRQHHHVRLKMTAVTCSAVLELDRPVAALETTSTVDEAYHFEGLTHIQPCGGHPSFASRYLGSLGSRLPARAEGGCGTQREGVSRSGIQHCTEVHSCLCQSRRPPASALVRTPRALPYGPSCQAPGAVVLESNAGNVEH